MSNLKEQKKYSSSNKLKNPTTAPTNSKVLSPFAFLSGNHLFYLLLIGLIYLVMIIIVNPIGNFPLNDDWIYAQPVSTLLNNGGYHVNNICSPIIISHVLWGSLFCLFSGFSFTTLRFSTLLMGLTGVFFFYFLAHDLSKNKKISFLAALLLLVNPLYFNLSNTFMTDIPFLAVVLCSIFFFFRYIDNSQLKYLVLATFFSVFATLIRQFGVAIPVAYGIYYAISQKKTIMQRIINFTPAIISILILEIALTWLKYIGSSPGTPDNTSILDFFIKPQFWTSEIKLRSENILFYYGLLFFPFLLFIKIPLFKELNSFLRITIIAFLLIIIIFFTNFYNGFPELNILNNGYLGPKTLSDVYKYKIPGHNVDHFSGFTFKIIYLIGGIGVIFLLIHLIRIIVKLINTPVSHDISTYNKQFFVLICTIGYLLSLFVPSTHFDRYMLPIFPLISLTIISETQTNNFIATFSSIFTFIYIPVIILFSAFGTHDYMAWNRARWQAANYLMKEQNISIHKIDGGYEVNGWLIGFGRIYDKQKLWGCVDDNTYMLSFGEINGSRVIKQFNYQNYYPEGTRSIYALQIKN
jgi:4-amino-4-deoxy-L-arabinose transferase-like glycosyltransferase